MADLFDNLWAPLRAFVVAIAGVWLASAWTHGAFGPFWAGALVVVAITAGVVVVGFIIEGLGRWSLPQRPVLALRLMETWAIAPLAVAVMAIAIATVVGIRFAAETTAPAAEKAVIEQTLTAISTFLTAAFVAWTGERDESPAATRIRKAFRDHYQRGSTPIKQEDRVRYFRRDSTGERLVQSEVVGEIIGWGPAARVARARGIARELANGTSDPP